MKETGHKQSEAGIFDTLLQLPLLKGASRARVQEIVGRFRLHFVKAAPGEVIVDEGCLCDAMIFILRGSVRLTAVDASRQLTVSQTLSAPQVIAPDYLFGLSTVYPCRVEAIDPVGLMKISKEEYRRLLTLDQVFLFNYLNMICAGSQRASQGLMSIAGGSAAERLSYWITTLTQPGSTDIELHAGQRELHTLLGISPTAMRAAIERLGDGASMADPHTLRLASR